MLFIETRGNDGSKPKEVEFSYAILNPSASFGGLYVPKSIPLIDSSFISKHIDSSYEELALDILKKFEIDIDEDVLKDALKLYRNFDDSSNPAPLKKVKNDLFVCELYHGPTRAFKDMALQPFGHILSDLAKKRQKNYLIMAATSGDTGPATLESFAQKERVKVVCLYPEGGTSDVQRLQMVCESSKNLKVIGIRGDFDDAQNALKALLADRDFIDSLEKMEINLSAANSVNFGRIIFQIIYHFYSYLKLLKDKEVEPNEKIYSIVPSGNFGNALGGYYAKKMGLPIEKIFIASNENSVLSDFINSGKYTLKNRKLKKTASPAMDILISSNIERVLHDLFGSERTKELLVELSNNREYELTSSELESLQKEFSAIHSDDEYGKKKIGELFKDGYLLDPHTATCIKAYENLKEKNLKCIAYSTAEWTKFAPTVHSALFLKSSKDDKEALECISKKAEVDIPEVVSSLFEKEVVHKDIINKEEIKETILEWL